MRTQLAAIFRPLLTALVLLAAFGLPALAEDNVRLQRSSPLQQVAAVSVDGKPNNNCAPDRLVEATADFGPTSRVPCCGSISRRSLARRC
ncbi:hypothetical protein ABIA85_001069 [Bradyrhizobium sp. LA6.10]